MSWDLSCIIYYLYSVVPTILSLSRERGTRREQRILSYYYCARQYCIGIVLFCIGGLKVHGSDKTTFSGYGKSPSCRNPDYLRTIDARGYPKLQVPYRNFRSALFGAFPTFRMTISN